MRWFRRRTEGGSVDPQVKEQRRQSAAAQERVADTSLQIQRELEQLQDILRGESDGSV